MYDRRIYSDRIHIMYISDNYADNICIYSVYDELNNITEVILIYSDVYMLYM